MSPSPLTRRKSLHMAAFGVATISGCASRATGPSQSTDSPTPTETQPLESSTPAPTVIDGVKVPPCPTKPDELIQESVVEYASQFEQSYVTRDTLRQQTADVSAVEVHIERGQAERTMEADDWWLVRLTVIAPYIQYRVSPDSDEPDHVDPGAYTASYYITAETVMRAQAVEAVDPREQGAVVHCPLD